MVLDVDICPTREEGLDCSPFSPVLGDFRLELRVFDWRPWAV
jgi:hypothetical protein